MLSFLLFPVDRPEFFDAVVTTEENRVREIQVKQTNAASNWIWGAFKMPGRVFADLRGLWHARDRADEYFGTLVNAWLAAGGEATGIRAGEAYVDVGTLHGYRAAMRLLTEARYAQRSAALPAAASPGWRTRHARLGHGAAEAVR
jgi:dTDP-glucose pyrophosphorylase